MYKTATCIKTEPDAEMQKLAHSTVAKKSPPEIKRLGGRRPHKLLVLGEIALVAPVVPAPVPPNQIISGI